MPISFSKRLILFLVVNFAALGIGGFLMGEGPGSDWYQNANQAPWTPPGWVFGAAWFTIMACFSVYMAFLTKNRSKKIIILYILLTLLNIGWNPLFFHLHLVAFALVIISLLTLLVFYTLIFFRKELKLLSLLIVPYAVWLVIATSLNAYFLFNNP
ncbi:MAG: TspO/MBR family protein [Crocinitomicaceae bacterium]